GRTRELLELRPNCLAVGIQAELTCLEIIFRKLAHLQHEPQIAALDSRPAPGTLEDFDQAARLLIAFQNAQDEQKIGWIGAVVFRVGIARLDNASLTGRKETTEEFAVPLLLFFAFVKLRFGKIDLGAEGQPAFFVQGPYRAANGCQSGDDAVQKTLIELFRRNL